jgi:hypothetical protein
MSNFDCPVVQSVARHYTDWASRLTLPTVWPNNFFFVEPTVLPDTSYS